MLAALLGASAGAVNGWLCWAELPEPVRENPQFGWVVVPAGAFHGAVLVLVPVFAASVLATWRPTSQFLMAPLVGWLAGYVSWIPLHHWVGEETWLESLVWPWGKLGGWTEASWVPFPHFGLVAVLYYVALVKLTQGGNRIANTAAAVCAGVLGSLWWWIVFKPWYFAVIHGSVWGLTVGWATSRVRQSHELGVA